MGAWPGTRRDQSSVGDGLQVSQNTRYRYGNELRQRVGLTRCTMPAGTGPITRIFAAQDYVYVVDSGAEALRSIAPTALTIGDPDTPGNSRSDYRAAYPSPVTIERVVYLYAGPNVSGIDHTLVFVGTGAIDYIGEEPPSDYTGTFTESTTTTGEVGVGRHLLRQRKFTTRGHLDVLSNPNAIVTVDIAGEASSIKSAQTLATNVYQEITPGDSATFYRTVRTDWSADSLPYFKKADTWLQQQLPTSINGDYGHEVPYDATIAVWVRGRMFICGYAGAPNRVYWSQAGLPESFYKTQFFFDALDNGDTVKGMFEHLGDLWVFGRATADRYVWATDPLSGERVVIPGSLGVWNQRCIVRADRALYGWGPNGVWVLEGGRQTHISRPIDDILQEEQDTDLSEQFHMCYNPDERLLQCFYTATGDSYPKSCAVLDVDNALWSTSSYDIGITSSATVMTADRPRVLLGDEYGKTWFQFGSNDGQDSVGSSLQTSGAGATTSTIPLPAATECTGAMLYQPASGELRRIASFSSGVATLATPLSAAPIEDEQLAVGGINFKLETKWWQEQTLAVKKQPVGFYIEYMPQDEGTLQVKIYKDFSNALVTYGDLVSTDTLPDGVTLVAGAFVIDLSGSGFVKVPMNLDNARALKAVIESDRLAPSPQLLRAYFQPEPHGNRRGDKD